MHAKVAVADGDVSLVSSYNLDLLSSRVNSEIGALMRSSAMAADVEDSVLRDLADPDNKIVELRIRRNPDGSPVRVGGSPVVEVGPDDHLSLPAHARATVAHALAARRPQHVRRHRVLERLTVHGYRRGADATARSVAVETRVVLATLAAEPRACVRHYVALARRFAEATQEERTSIAPRPTERIAALLLTFAQKMGRAVAGGTLIDRAIPQDELAVQTATNRRTVVRAFSLLFKSGALKRSGRKLIVVDGNRLAQAAINAPATVG